MVRRYPRRDAAPEWSGGVIVYYVHADHSTRRGSSPTRATIPVEVGSDPFGDDAPNENPASLGAFKYNLRFPGQ